MANEAVKVELFGPNNDGQATRYDIAASAAVSIGAVLQLLDARTASSGIVQGKPAAGIVAFEKTANDGTDITLWTQGIFEMVASGSINVGDPIIASNNNKVAAITYGAAGEAVLAASTALIIGRALEEASADETINVRINL